MSVSIKTLALVSVLLTLAVGAITMRDRDPVQAAAPLGIAAQAVDAPSEPAGGGPDTEPLDPIPSGAEYQPTLIDCVYWSLPAVDEAASIDHRVESDNGSTTLSLEADLGRMGTFQVAGTGTQVQVTGTDRARAALMQYEMSACLGTIQVDQAEYDALMQAAGQAWPASVED